MGCPSAVNGLAARGEGRKMYQKRNNRPNQKGLELQFMSRHNQHQVRIVSDFLYPMPLPSREPTKKIKYQNKKTR